MDKEKIATTENKPLMHHMNKIKNNYFFSPKMLTVLIVAILLGVGSGYVLAKNTSGGLSTIGKMGNSSSTVSKGTVVGSDDMKTFKDTAEGILQEGGIEGEGQFHLVRPGGDSQNVYLTSSSVDLSQFIKKKVKVWGQTQKAQTAGWLMDVGKVEVLE